MVVEPSGTPSLVPARVRRVGELPVPRVRPLAEVLPVRDRPAEVAAPGTAVDRAQDELDRLAAALRPVAARLLAAVADVLAGRRPPAHLDALLAPGALATLARAAPPPGRRRAGGAAERSRTTDTAAGARPPVASGAGLRGLRVCAVDRRAAEVAAVVHGRDRVRALAARLERDDDGSADPGRWRVVALCPG